MIVNFGEVLGRLSRERGRKGCTGCVAWSALSRGRSATAVHSELTPSERLRLASPLCLVSVESFH